jgi:hypothetical protein
MNDGAAVRLALPAHYRVFVGIKSSVFLVRKRPLSTRVTTIGFMESPKILKMGGTPLAGTVPAIFAPPACARLIS